MSAPVANAVTGQRAASLKVIAAISAATLLGVSGLVWFFFGHRASNESASNAYGGGGIEPTIQTLKSGKSPEALQEEEAHAQWQKSLNLSPDELASRQVQAQRKNAPETQVTRQAREVNIGSEMVMQDVAAAQSAQMIGSSNATIATSGGGLPSISTSGSGGQSGQGGTVAYLPLSARLAIAAQQANSGRGSNTPVEDGSKSNGPQMILFEEPSPPSIPAPDERVAERKPDSERMPVNVLPPYTVPIPCSFMGNFIVSGTGADTTQRVIVNVEQDVIARNRVQLPRGTKLIGHSGGVRDLDLADITFDILQFPDFTQVPIKGQAYQPFTPEAPDNFMMRGVMGEYEEPSIPKQLAPIFLEALRKGAQSNLERLAQGGVQIVPTAGGTSRVAVETSDRDRLFAAGEGAMDKLIEMMMQKLQRYRPRVRIRAGQPLIVLLDDYVDLSKRTFMGHGDPLKQKGDEPEASPPELGPLPLTQRPAASSTTVAPTGAAPVNPPITRDVLRDLLKGASAEDLKALQELAGAPTK